MTKAECIRELQAEYQAQRARNEAELEARVDEAGRADPEILKLKEANRDLAFETMRRILTLEDPDARRKAAERMRAGGLSNNAEIRRRLAAAGFPEDYLEMRYRCAVCRDSGYVGDAPARFCGCFEARLRMMLCEDGSMAGLDEQCFDRFDLTRFPEADGQRAQMASVRRACEDYANHFPDTKYPNLVLTGSGGLGKTFLLNCIYERVIRRGYSAVRVTAFRMFETMRRQHFAAAPEEMNFDQLIDAPLLLIDDLGSEPMMRNITVEYLFTLLNERMAARRHTVVATNLSPLQIQETYGERVSSRLMDRSLCATMLLKGRDLRRL